MPENPSTPPPPQQLEYGRDTIEDKKPGGSKLMLILVWLLGLVSWIIWLAIILYVFLKFIVW
jgi:hypothetical protein